MRFKLWLYKKDGLLNLVLNDGSRAVDAKGAWKLRDQSNYGNELVWKDASYPTAIRNAVMESESICIGEFAHEHLADANINWRALDYLWKNLERPNA